MFKAVDTESGKIIGAARWIVVVEDEVVRESVGDAVEGSLELAAFPEMDLRVARGFYEMAVRGKRGVLEVGDTRSTATAGGEVILRRRVELETLFVHPEFQGQGVGKALLQWGIDEAERLGFVVYLEATEAGRPLYERFGFEEVKVVEFDAAEFGGVGGQTYTFMVRIPRDIQV
ncbi:acyl-CoA N-acyltransferase [Aspergillus crustosus]